MKTFDPSIVNELAKEGFKFFLLTTMELASGTYRQTDADIDLWTGGNKYDARDFTFDRVNTSGTMGVDSVSMTFNNADLAMGALVLSEDILGRPFTLSFICVAEEEFVLSETAFSILLEGGLIDGEKLLKETEQTLGPFSIVASQSLFYGLISDWNFEDDTVWIEVENELVFWAKKALRKSDSACPWEFKETECGYSGAHDWCNQSYERCQELSNTDNFGGDRFLPAIAEKDIWWGRSPK